MKLISCVLFLLIFSVRLFAQDKSLAEKAYLHVLQNGFSTAPEFVVITITNANTGESKEICVTATVWFNALEMEYLPNSEKSYIEYLRSNSHSRTFALTKPDALKNIGFVNYHLKHEKRISEIIVKNHLRDSLKKINLLREAAYKEGNLYRRNRRIMLLTFTDSIKKYRNLNPEEDQIIKDLNESVSYEESFDNPKSFDYKKLSEKGLHFMALWRTQIRSSKQKYNELSKESNRLYEKFFQRYYKKYGMNFCHVGFKHGIITFLGDEVAYVGYGIIID
ncbi:hypothetical protein [Mucilaginibacter sp.]|jgi:hypothetical protein|uniref:hypothetical protein n=1 Tax=Mucilaginibacter sp. TaxID=1882438 RepID=UPI002C29CF94|nr:hypothetical protein [Mucilaginibacter sp.]HTI61549.1 hypothetical protein [Mucilaginibacter sp.]